MKPGDEDFVYRTEYCSLCGAPYECRGEHGRLPVRMPFCTIECKNLFYMDKDDFASETKRLFYEGCRSMGDELRIGRES